MINDLKIIQEILEELDNTCAEDLRKAVDEALKEGGEEICRKNVTNAIVKNYL